MANAEVVVAAPAPLKDGLAPPKEAIATPSGAAAPEETTGETKGEAKDEATEGATEETKEDASKEAASKEKDGSAPRRMPTMQSLVKRVSMVAKRGTQSTTVADAALAEVQERLQRVEASLRTSRAATDAAHDAWAGVITSQRDFAEMFATSYPEEDVVAEQAAKALDATTAAHKSFVQQGKAPAKPPRMPRLMPKVTKVMTELADKLPHTKGAKEAKEAKEEAAKSDDDAKADAAGVTSGEEEGATAPRGGSSDAAPPATPSHVAINTKVVDAYLAEITSVLAACKATEALKADAVRAAAKVEKRSKKAKAGRRAAGVAAAHVVWGVVAHGGRQAR
eukprot:TRINITY_DN1123_c0_g1_i4.p3 TRINITY_DN1123_c0_g1~~TRINITY_DN1123_c0_g1_i4.p3  ORF type:complete len:337 (-),score=151.18 TRINITY_DN1123_c0_g1_i4:1034-2044(-)